MSDNVKYVSSIMPGRAGGFEWTIRSSGGTVKSGTDRTQAAAENNARDAMEMLAQMPAVKTRAKKRG